MKTSFKLFTILITGIISPNSYAFPELPFCPAGGPPGWLNYFNDKRDQNNWRRYSRYNYALQRSSRYPSYYGPAYSPMHRPYNHTVRPGSYAPHYLPK